MMIVDLKLNPSRLWISRFESLISSLNNQPKKDPLHSNYENLDKTWEYYDSFTLLVLNETIVGFSGMHTAPYPEHTCRVLSRLFYSKDIRNNSLAGHKLPGLASRLMLPHQIDVARRMNKKAVFLSFQGSNRRKFCFKLANALNVHFKTDGWEVAENMIYTAKRLKSGQLNMSANVWQNAIYFSFNLNYRLEDIPQMSLIEWNLRFKETQGSRNPS